MLEPGVSLSLGATSKKMVKTGSSSSLHFLRIDPPVGSELVPVACGLQTLKLYTLFYSLLECFPNCDPRPKKRIIMVIGIIVLLKSSNGLKRLRNINIFYK